MTATRLSALDASFLEVETRTAHMHVGWAAVFEPPEGRPRPTFDQLFEHIGGRMAWAPRYRQRLAEVPFGAADPVWVDDTDFRLERHVHGARSGETSRVSSTTSCRSRLRRDRPLWEIWVADRLEDGRIGIVGKAHHCMVDGLAAVELATLLLDPDPEPPEPQPDSWRPATPPSGLGLLAGGLVNRAESVLQIASSSLRLAARPARPSGSRRSRSKPGERSSTPCAPASATRASRAVARRCATWRPRTGRSRTCARPRMPSARR